MRIAPINIFQSNLKLKGDIQSKLCNKCPGTNAHDVNVVSVSSTSHCDYDGQSGIQGDGIIQRLAGRPTFKFSNHPCNNVITAYNVTILITHLSAIIIPVNYLSIRRVID